MHLTYDIDEQDLLRGNRQKIISDALSVFHVEDRDGELTIDVPDHKFGDALYDFVQALLKITDVSFLTRERAQNTFVEDFRSIFTELIPEQRRTFDWHDRKHDPEGKYAIDCRINGMPRPIFIHALLNDAQTRDATITLHQFERWQIPFNSLAIFNDQEAIIEKSSPIQRRMRQAILQPRYQSRPNRAICQRYRALGNSTWQIPSHNLAHQAQSKDEKQ